MFGIVCSGRPVQIAEQIEPMKYVITLPNAENINYVTLFLLPNTEFVDPNYTALVYILLPNSQEFKLLGGINPLKPSAIYRIRGLSTSAGSQFGDVNDVKMDETPGVNCTVQIGILVEVTAQAESILAQSKNVTTSASGSVPTSSSNSYISTDNLANQIVKNAYNFISGFTDEKGNVPISVFDKWWAKFKQRLASDPQFLDKVMD